MRTSIAWQSVCLVLVTTLSARAQTQTTCVVVRKPTKSQVTTQRPTLDGDLDSYRTTKRFIAYLRPIAARMYAALPYPWAGLEIVRLRDDERKQQRIRAGQDRKGRQGQEDSSALPLDASQVATLIEASRQDAAYYGAEAGEQQGYIDSARGDLNTRHRERGGAILVIEARSAVTDSDATGMQFRLGDKHDSPCPGPINSAPGETTIAWRNSRGEELDVRFEFRDPAIYREQCIAVARDGTEAAIEYCDDRATQPKKPSPAPPEPVSPTSEELTKSQLGRVGPDEGRRPAKDPQEAPTIWPFWLFGGIAVSGLVVGGGALVVAENEVPECPRNRCESEDYDNVKRASGWRLTSWIGFGVAGAAVVGGLTYLAWPSETRNENPIKDNKTRKALRVSPILTGQGAGISVRSAF